MEGIIVSYRRAKHSYTGNQMVVLVSGYENREKASELIDKKVVYKTESGKEITGIVKRPHGNSGKVLVHFEKGMPGQAVSKKVVFN
ncbi:50S ribosomal protein L35ae [Candidatus Woesearchaeota archaeon]|jgi:ribosomal protein L35AE/L33A|nr:50S ribosomal protein L35ae [Candidatus Woesearchaeota archaeon]MBT4387116.1 50S ribosomal protein L35ae [Candidatus Woesearchaeota archaeon]MBT4596127.1 50S ribosomal protein L35ae [Candidatus Woesearchaeota archaeon]MBT5741650.1 50S ribosomal protein L35ae [Candidatus Woesearchaeota archaeon]MBT6505671.1 50S ribosomal protein L35ae [Candidatus Woesearchaeota archaeon]